MCAASCSVSGQKTDRTEEVSRERTVELCLGTDLGWDTCGPCFTLCPHWGSGWARGRQGAERGVLNLNIQKTKIMSSSPITLWQIDGETVETVANFF